MKTVKRHTGAPPRSGLPPSVCVGQSVLSDPGGALFYTNFYEHKCLYSDTYGRKLISESDQSRSEHKINGVLSAEYNLGKNINCNITETIHYLINNYLTLCFNEKTMENTELIAQQIEVLEGEIWIPLAKSPEKYSISSHGRVFSWLSRYKYNTKPRGLLKPHKHNLGYLYQCLWGYGRIGIHRLVAMTFLQNPDNKPEVNHIDHNKANNRVDNLEWVTHQENIQKSFTGGYREIYSGERHWMTGREVKPGTRRKQSLAKMGEKHPKFKGYYMINGVKYPSANQAAKKLNTSATQVVRKCKNPSISNWEFIPL